MASIFDDRYDQQNVNVYKDPTDTEITARQSDYNKYMQNEYGKTPYLQNVFTSLSGENANKIVTGSSDVNFGTEMQKIEQDYTKRMYDVASASPESYVMSELNENTGAQQQAMYDAKNVAAAKGLLNRSQIFARVNDTYNKQRQTIIEKGQEMQAQELSAISTEFSNAIKKYSTNAQTNIEDYTKGLQKWLKGLNWGDASYGSDEWLKQYTTQQGDGYVLSDAFYDVIADFLTSPNNADSALWFMQDPEISEWYGVYRDVLLDQFDFEDDTDDLDEIHDYRVEKKVDYYTAKKTLDQNHAAKYRAKQYSGGNAEIQKQKETATNIVDANIFGDNGRTQLDIFKYKVNTGIGSDVPNELIFNDGYADGTKFVTGYGEGGYKNEDGSSGSVYKAYKLVINEDDKIIQAKDWETNKGVSLQDEVNNNGKGPGYVFTGKNGKKYMIVYLNKNEVVKEGIGVIEVEDYDK